MNKKILMGLSALGVAAGFWACGDGAVETMGNDDEIALANYGEFNPEGMSNLVQGAMAACEADPACAAKMEGATYVPPEEEPGEGEGDEQGSEGGDQGSGEGNTNPEGGNTTPGGDNNATTTSSSSTTPNTNPTEPSSNSNATTPSSNSNVTPPSSNSNVTPPSSANVTPSSANVTPSSANVTQSSTSTQSAASGGDSPCIAWVNGTGGYGDHCYNSGLSNMEEGKCYTLNPSCGQDPSWINENANDTYWWMETSCQ